MKLQRLHIYIVYIIVAALFAGSFFFTPSVHAAVADVTISPVVIDKKGMVRDILSDTITITNNEPHRKISIYASVNNIEPEAGKQQFEHYQKADKSTSLANWIEIRRAVIELEAGETREVPVNINIGPYAKPGIYHAVITFSEGSSRGMQKLGEVFVNLEIGEDVKEILQLKKFVPDKRFFTGFPVTFSYEVENIGNRTQTPKGTVRIYNRRGEEITTVPANEGSATLDPEAEQLMASAWQSAESRAFGRYKAVLNLEYGANGTSLLQDTVFFWIVPLPWLVGIFFSLAFLVVLLSVVIHKRYEAHYVQLHQQMLRQQRMKKAMAQQVVVSGGERHVPVKHADTKTEEATDADDRGSQAHQSETMNAFQNPTYSKKPNNKKKMTDIRPDGK